MNTDGQEIKSETGKEKEKRDKGGKEIKQRLKRKHKGRFYLRTEPSKTILEEGLLGTVEG